MKARGLTFAAVALAGLAARPADAGQIYSVTYTDLTLGTTTDLTAAGTLDWVKWGNGEPSGTLPYSSPEKVGGTIINPALTPLGTAPAGQSVILVPFTPPPTILDFSWTDGTQAMAGGVPTGTVVSQTIGPTPQFSYPLGLGASFQAAADAAPLQMDVYVQGFNTRMLLSATLSGGANASLLASNAALVPVAGAANNYFSMGYFSILYSGAGETLTIDLTANNQAGVPTNAPQYVFRNAGFYAATVVPGQVVPEPSSMVLTALGFTALVGTGYGLRKARSARPTA